VYVKRKHWKVSPQVPADYASIMQDNSIHPVLSQVFFGRGYTDPYLALDFLGIYPHSDDPFLMTGMDQAVDRLLNAIQSDERIAIYGDFDCDGVTSTVLLTEVLRRLCGNGEDVKKRITPYIPNRVDEGYGLNSPALKELADKGYNVVITVDCGIRSVQEVEDGNSYGLDIIISDHHSLGPELPLAVAVINPKQADCQYPEKMLAGVGLAYKIAQGLHIEAQRRGFVGVDTWNPDDWLDLVAIGTVADIAPLQGENRKLVREGLKRLNTPQRPGLRALYGVAGIKPGAVNTITIGFMVGPRINAAGRLQSAYDAAKLLTADNVRDAAPLAQKLESLNEARQYKTREMQEWAQEMIPDVAEQPLLFASDSRFEQGVVGLVASRLTEEYYRPSVVVQIGDEESHGSCRSIPEFHITEALDECADLLERYGGHAAAAGFTVRNDNIEYLQARLLELAGVQLAGKELYPALQIDGELMLNQCTLETAHELAKLEPCGEANRQPLFMTRGVMVCNSQQIGKDGRHLKLEFTQNSPPIEAIAFRMGEEQGNLPGQADIAYHIEANEWNGQRRLQLNIKDIRPAE
jgi:single-stranded-DNA-specific exonuclease